jgi:hypothetical protein
MISANASRIIDLGAVCGRPSMQDQMPIKGFLVDGDVRKLLALEELAVDHL